MDANSGDFPEAEAFGSLNPPVAREDSSRSVNHDWPYEPETLDTFRQLLNLPLTVNPRISGIEFQICNGNSSDGGRQI